MFASKRCSKAIGSAILPPMRLRSAGLALFALFVSCAASSGPGVLYEGDSPYNHIIVAQDAQGVRRLFFEKDGAVQSAIKPGVVLELELPYARAAMLSLAVHPAPKRVLIIGLGGGAMPMFLRALYPEAEIEVVDIDPDVVKVASKYFGFKEDAHLKAFVADGRDFVEKAKLGWDLVFLDAYGKGSIPRRLATVEFLKTVRGKLAPGGLVVGNVWEPASNPLYAAMTRTYAEAFPDFCVINVPLSGNRIFLANQVVMVTEKLVEQAAAITKKRKLPFEMSIYAKNGCARDVDSAAPLLSDADKPE
jgi:spermidine synthase